MFSFLKDSRQSKLNTTDRKQMGIFKDGEVGVGGREKCG